MGTFLCLNPKNGHDIQGDKYALNGGEILSIRSLNNSGHMRLTKSKTIRSRVPNRSIRSLTSTGNELSNDQTDNLRERILNLKEGFQQLSEQCLKLLNSQKESSSSIDDISCLTVHDSQQNPVKKSNENDLLTQTQDVIDNFNQYLDKSRPPD